MTEPGTLVRVTGALLAQATRYNLQKLRCAICEIIYTAPLPKGVSNKKYDANFVAMLMINKYFMSVPLYRQDRLQNHLGIPLPASTQWDLMAAHEPMLKALHEAIAEDAANGSALCYDDTSVKIMSEIKAAKLADKGNKSQHTCFTTGIVSLHEDHRTYLYITDNRTAGKCIAEIMKRRDTDLDPPIMMCDALAANIPQGIADDLYILCFCLVHARRQFYELPNGYDDLADKVIGLIGNIYDNEAHTKGYSPERRLAYHQEKSTPIMEELKAYLEEQKQEFEPNSVPGKAIDYILNRWAELSQFLRQVHAPLDTNIVERALKLVIQVRKSSMFYKTLESAAFASYVQSALYSAAQNEINPCDYMCALIENEQAVIQNPKAWLPWCFKQSLEASAKQDASVPDCPD
jgi:transposase